METLLVVFAHHVAIAIQLIAVLTISLGVVDLVIELAKILLGSHDPPRHEAERAAWLNFARWLVAGLTLQLASDIVETTIAPTWGEIGRLAAIAAVRTFLSYFLDRDVELVRERQRQTERVQLAVHQARLSTPGSSS